MYAIFQSGGKQYRVNIGQIIRLEKLDIEVGNNIEFHKVIMIIDDNKTCIGHPFVNKSKIEAKIISHGRNKKINILKFHRRKNYRKHQGHRQWFTDVKITNIYY